MIEELARHIKALLADNDCVILPELGGFVIQHLSACHIPEENMFVPPCRKVAFNTQLSLNDGLLVQAYMQAYDTGYPKALRMVEAAVSALRDLLAQEGEAKLLGIGTLRVTLDSRIEFVPEDREIFSPALYGFCAFEMFPLSEVSTDKEVVTGKTKKKNAVVISINKRWINTAVAAVVAIVLFFAWSAPVDNTYIEPENYAFLGDVRVFDNIRSQSVATSPVRIPVCDKEAAAAPTKETKRVDAVKEDTKLPDSQPALQETEDNVTAEPEVVAPKNGKRYHIIIASAANEAEAEKTVRLFKSQGHPEVSTIESDGRIRIVLQSFDNKDEAMARCNEARNQELFSGAWIYVSRN